MPTPEEKAVLVQEIIQKVYPELKPINFIPVVTTVEQKEFILFLKQCITKYLKHILYKINNFEHWYNEQILTDDLKDTFCKNSGWTLDEATSLILGKNPNEVTLDKLVKMFENIFTNIRLPTEVRKNLIHPIISNYKAQRNQIDLAIEFKKITDIKTIYLNDNYVLFVPPQKVLKWCKEKEIKLPDGIEELVIKYNSVEIEQAEEKCIKCSDELEQLRTEVLDLQRDLSVPNAKRAKSLYKGFIGLLALQYKRDKILQSFGTNTGRVNPNDKPIIALNKIKNDLDLQGINLDDETIRDIIKESIPYLEEKLK
jgi:hypothetical protein